MTIFTQVDPERFIKPERHLPEFGRGVWNDKGKANGSWRYEYTEGKPSIGTNAETSLDAWATCAGSYAWQMILMRRGFLRLLHWSEEGIFGPATEAAVVRMQRATEDPETGRRLEADGTIGRHDAKALLAPLIDAAEDRHDIPSHYLRGETNLESAMDTGALGTYIYYGIDRRFAGVDRSNSQINSKSNAQVSWPQAFNPYFSIDWSAEQMRDYHDRFADAYPHQDASVLWDAALCSHNSPLYAWSWAKHGIAPNETAARYVRLCKAARF